MKRKPIYALSFILLIFSISLISFYSTAWFFDNISNKNNSITTGNLKADLSYCKDFNCPKTLSLNKNSQYPIFSDKLWQPGDSEVTYFTLKNCGSLPLNYVLNFTSEETYSLAQHIKVYIKAGGSEVLDFNPKLALKQGFTYIESLDKIFLERLNLKEKENLSSDESDDFVLVLYLDEQATNLYQEESVENFQVNLSISQSNYTNKHYISSYSDLKAVADAVNSGSDSFVDKVVVLEADIDLNNLAWQPIGTIDFPFKGSFDGQNKTIKNLSVSDANLENVGLFGYVDKSNTYIKNLSLDNVSLEAKSKVGGLLGFGRGVSISNIKINTIRINGNSDYTGGLVGYLDGRVSNALVKDLAINLKDASNNQESHSTGGLVGYSSGSDLIYEDLEVSNLKISGGRNVGGIIGHNTGNLTLINTQVGDSSGVSTISALAQSLSYVGGLVGYSDSEVILINCRNIDTTVVSRSSEFAGSLIGYPKNK